MGILGQQILVPLTTSLYVPGRTSVDENVLVDVGTGYYVEKTPKDAAAFYVEKVDELGKNCKDLEAILQGKSNSVRLVEEILRSKMMQTQQGQSQSGAQIAQAGT